ncbi:MAG: glycosyltransferase family 4 protein, partial [Armatimonadetes bacterium]|nr:glycosyltransferase family 4 protein [Armatimonadota bacterium]
GRNVWLRDLGRVRALARSIERVAAEFGDIEVLHAHSPMLCGLAALQAGAALRVPVVYEVRGLWEEAFVQGSFLRRFGLRYQLARRLDGRVCQRADAVVAISESLRSDLIRRGIPGDKVTVVPNAVDTEVFTPREVSVQQRSDLGLSEGPLVLYLGAVRHYEGVEVLLRAFSSVRSRVPRAHLAIIGAGEASQQIASLAAECGEGVTVMPAVPHESVADFYAAADVVVYPRLSTRATELITPLKPLEAMAMAKAIVASDVGGLREILTDGVTARLVPPGSADTLAAAIVELLEDDSERRRLGEAARETVSRGSTWRQVVQRYMKVYESVVPARQG